MSLTHYTDRLERQTRDFFTPTLRIGVTGLARSGKTVFLSALAHNLLQGGQLPYFGPARRGLLEAAYAGAPSPELELFRYERYLKQMLEPPRTWPRRTDALAELRITLVYRGEGGLLPSFGPRTLNLELLDYPGEWLLDLPLLNQSFATFSAQALQLAERPERRRLAEPFLRFVADTSPEGPRDNERAIAGANLFRAYLQACRGDGTALSTLPPGRYLEPGADAGKPMLNFIPLPVEAGVNYPADSMAAQMEAWFEAYKRELVLPFFQDHFSRLDRQIVLVDVLKALNAGPEAVADLSRALTQVCAAFRQGQRTWWSSLFSPRIDRVMFAATKADHLHDSGHDRLEAVMRTVVSDAVERAELSGAKVGATALAGVRATRQVRVKGKDGNGFLAIAGVPLAGETIDGRTYDGQKEAIIYPGTLPEDPRKALDERQNIRFIRFAPPEPRPWAPGGAPILGHIRLDRVLQFLIGDRMS